MEVRFTSEEARARWEAAHREDLAPDNVDPTRDEAHDRDEPVWYGYDAW